MIKCCVHVWCTHTCRCACTCGVVFLWCQSSMKLFVAVMNSLISGIKLSTLFLIRNTYNAIKLGPVYKTVLFYCFPVHVNSSKLVQECVQNDLIRSSGSNVLCLLDRFDGLALTSQLVYWYSEECMDMRQQCMHDWICLKVLSLSQGVHAMYIPDITYYTPMLACFVSQGLTAVFTCLLRHCILLVHFLRANDITNVAHTSTIIVKHQVSPAPAIYFTMDI